MKIRDINLSYLISLLLVTIFCCCSDADNAEEKDPPDNQITTIYTNPVYTGTFPDPSIIRGRDKLFYAFSGSGIRVSADMIHWKEYSSAFNGSTNPDWYSGDGVGVWASNVLFNGNKYYMYYALSKLGEYHRNGLGVATSLNAGGPYTDQGKFFTSDEIGVMNSIDPFCFIDTAKDGLETRYLVWGSFWGIYIVKLTSNGLKLASEKIPLAGKAFEAPMIYKRGDWYYLFLSPGNCWGGETSTYKVVVGRSKNILGPYIDKKDRQMLGMDTKEATDFDPILLQGNDKFFGPGHHSELITDDEGKTWFLYHAYDARRLEAGRILMLDEITWDEDAWPVIEGGTPSSIEKQGPIFK